MMSPSSGLYERMVWFWHTHLTTHHAEVTSDVLVSRQLELLRTHAMGNFRDLLQGFVVDGALLQYLDGDGSLASKPNENLARELMELFTVGLGNFTEDDVRTAARALAGWTVDQETNEVVFDRERAFIAPLLFRGKQADFDTGMIVDHLCDDLATAAYVSNKLWHHLAGGWLDEPSAGGDGSVVAEPGPGDQAVGRPHRRTPAVRAQRVRPPPHRAARWSSPSTLPTSMSRCPARSITSWTGLYSVGQETLDALNRVGVGADLDEESRAEIRWRLAFSSPEFQLT